VKVSLIVNEKVMQYYRIFISQNYCAYTLNEKLEVHTCSKKLKQM